MYIDSAPVRTRYPSLCSRRQRQKSRHPPLSISPAPLCCVRPQVQLNSDCHPHRSRFYHDHRYIFLLPHHHHYHPFHLHRQHPPWHQQKQRICISHSHPAACCHIDVSYEFLGLSLGIISISSDFADLQYRPLPSSVLIKAPAMSCPCRSTRGHMRLALDLNICLHTIFPRFFCAHLFFVSDADMLLPLPTPLAPVPSLRTAKYNTIPFCQIDLCVSCAIFLRHSLLNKKKLLLVFEMEPETFLNIQNDMHLKLSPGAIIPSEACS